MTRNGVIVLEIQYSFTIEVKKMEYGTEYIVSCKQCVVHEFPMHTIVQSFLLKLAVTEKNRPDRPTLWPLAAVNGAAFTAVAVNTHTALIHIGKAIIFSKCRCRQSCTFSVQKQTLFRLVKRLKGRYCLYL